VSRGAPDLGEFESLTEAEDLRRQLANAQRRIRRMRSDHAVLVEAVKDGASEALHALGPLPPVKPPKADRRKGKPEVALWHLTDWQGSKETVSYNSEVMRERILRYCDKAEKLTQIQRADHPVKQCTILLGGDMIEGLFNFPSQPFEIDASLFGQFSIASKLVAEVVRRALAIYETVEVIEEWGNHGRIGSKRSAVPRSDNFDRMVYALAQEAVGEEKRITWRSSEEDIHHFEIGNYAALLIHGDEIGRNGAASINTLVKYVTQLKAGAYDKPFTDVYAGHLHSHRDIELPDGGSYFQTGSPETDNRYARDSMAATSRPTQRLHFIDPKRGRVTAQYKVDLS
jgi:hypothetical protein